MLHSGKDQELHLESKEVRSKHKKCSLFGMVVATSLLIDLLQLQAAFIGKNIYEGR